MDRRTPENDPEWQAWVATRPKVVQELAAEFPVGSTFTGDDGETLYLVGYDEDGNLLVVDQDPLEHEFNQDTSQVLCADCCRRERGGGTQ